MLTFTLIISAVLAPGLLHAGSLALWTDGSPFRREFWTDGESWSLHDWVRDSALPWARSVLDEVGASTSQARAYTSR
jgi:hypothetical protein